MFRPVHERTSGVDGYVSLEVSPLLADDAEATIEERAAVAPRCPAESPDQDPRDGPGSGRHRAGDLRRHPDQCDAPVQARSVPRLCRGLHARH
ncbi:MAG: hypothetical protein H0T59_11360 [Chloroflexi bacterium]|nr:hypothetical protein [Chloroflexota bacterium]